MFRQRLNTWRMEQVATLERFLHVGTAMTLREYFAAHPAAIAAAFIVFTLLFAMAALLLYRQKSMKLIEKKNRELQAEAQRADKASAAKSKFLSSMSHDMRTPLNGVISFTNFALKADTLEKKQEYLEKTRQSAAMRTHPT